MPGICEGEEPGGGGGVRRGDKEEHQQHFARQGDEFDSHSNIVGGPINIQQHNEIRKIEPQRNSFHDRQLHERTQAQNQLRFLDDSHRKAVLQFHQQNEIIH